MKATDTRPRTYTDEGGNPAAQHYRDMFDDMVSQPDMQALNDQGDAAAREHAQNLQNAESSPYVTDNFYSEKKGRHRKDADLDARKAEASLWQAPQNRLNLNASARFRQLTNKKNLIRLGAGGGVVGTALASFMMLLPLKLPGALNMIMEQVGQKAEYITEKRAKVIIARSILTRFGSHTGIVITGGGAFKTLVASLRTNNFEKRLAAKGLTITPTPDGVKLMGNGKPLGGGKVLKSEAAIIDAIDNATTIDNQLLKKLVREEIPAWRLFKRAKFAKWLRIKYGIPRYGLKNSTKETPEDRKKEMDLERTKTANSRSSKTFSELIQCLMSGSCERMATTGGEKSKAANDTDKPTEALDAENAKIEREVAEKGLTTAVETGSKSLLSAFGSKAIPIIGWIDLLATIDHLVYSAGEDDYFGKVVSFYRGAAYAAAFADWSGYASQSQLGAMDTEYVGELSKQLDGMEESQSFQLLSTGDASKGTPIEMKVDSDKPSEVSNAFKNYINSPLGAEYKYIGHPILDTYYETIGSGGLLGWVVGLIAKPVGWLGKIFVNGIASLTPDAIKEGITDAMKDVFKEISPYLFKFLGITISTLDRGAALFNNLFGGGVVSSNGHLKDIGARRLSDESGFEMEQAIAKEKQADLRDKGILYALFSPEQTRSITSRLAYNIPSSPTSKLHSLSSAVLSTPTQIAGIVAPSVAAVDSASFEKLYGVAPYGATSTDLALPLDQNVIDGNDCPQVPEDSYNGCSIDQNVVEAMLCDFKECSDEDSGSDVDSITGSSSDMVVGTYNIQHQQFTSKCWPTESHEQCIDRRSAQAAKIIAGKVTDADCSGCKLNPQINIIGMQEVSPPQFNKIKAALTDYDGVPANVPENRGIAVLWNKTLYQKENEGDIATIDNAGDPNRTPWVKLKSAAGNKFYVMSIHSPNDHSGGSPAKRESNSRAYLQWAKDMIAQDPEAYVMFMGDFNRDLNNRGAHSTGHYCIITQEGIMQNAYDLAQGKDPGTPCPTQEGLSIDHIYISPKEELGAEGWHRAPQQGIYAQASDHEPVYVTLKIPGEGGAGGWSWPLGEKQWKAHRSAFLGDHYKGGGFLGSGNSSVDISWGDSDTGTPVYAMLSGNVITQPLGRSSYTCSGEPNGDNNGGMMIESDLDGKKVVIAYAHGDNPKFTAGDTVNGGEQIMALGNVGNSCGSHLHMDATYNGKNFCLQDLFLAMDKGETPDMEKLVEKATPTCSGRI